MLYTEQAQRHGDHQSGRRGSPTNRGCQAARRVALAWLRTNPVVVAPLIGATRQSHIDDAVASLQTTLTADEISALASPYTPRYDLQGISDDKETRHASRR